MSTLSRDYRQLGERLAGALGYPAVTGLYLPAPVDDETFRDEFGFVFLDDGTVGPFYVSMGDILHTLGNRYPNPESFAAGATSVLQGFDTGDPARRALAVGTYNALSTRLFRLAGYVAPDRAPVSGIDDVPRGTKVGMVGYFCPLVDKLPERGSEVLILEQAPQRVSERPGVSLTDDARDLRRCGHVICTAATLINDTLSDVLAAVSGHVDIEIIGPSGSGLPDLLFVRGVASVGGVSFADRSRLLDQLGSGESWGAAGRKYQLSPEDYPGFTRLLERLAC